jgi:signal transduction histidine kinase
MGKLNRIIQVYEGEQDRLFHHTARAALAQMANAVADEFRCLEASIFLVAVGENEHAQLEATTFSPYVMKDVYARGEPGLTGWILGHERSVRIFDLKFFDRDHQAITKDYDGLTWSGQPHLLEVTRAKLGLSEPDYLQPLSFMGVPIKVGKELLGVIRCCTPLRAPYYFDEQDVKLLELAASQIGQYWKNWIQWVAIQNENRSWQSLVRSVRDLIRAGSSRIEADVSAMLKQVLAVARDTIGEASTVDVRLFDPGRGGLYFAEVAGEGWKSGNLKIDQERLEEVFPLDKKSAGAWVYKENRVRVIPDVKKDSQYIGRFPNVKSMVIAPVSSGRERYGVLDVRFTKEAGIPPQASAIAELLGQQLGLYLNLSSTLQRVREAEEGLQRNVAELRGAKAEREKEMQVQKRVFEDLKHQLQGPILQAHARISKQIRGEISAGKIESNEKAVRGLVGKAKRVVSGMQVFVDLAEQKKLRLKPVVLEKDRLLKMLIEACIDSTFLEGLTSRGLKSWVDEASFDVLNYTTVKCDVDLLEQAVYNIIDNACKYSFSLQTIRVAGGLGTDGRFYISVVNKGLPLTEEEIPNVAKRGWRGMNSVLATGQGSGIGCWFVDQVMTAHGGRLVLSPTTPEQLTEVRLQF